MKNLAFIITFFVFVIFLANNLVAQQDSTKQENKKNNSVIKSEKKHGLGFVDKDGDGYNDNAPDHDGDGIPNGLDPDYKKGDRKKGFIDLDGDGINDNSGFGKRKGIQKDFNSGSEFNRKGRGPQRGNVTGVEENNSNEQGSTLRGKKGKRKGGN